MLSRFFINRPIFAGMISIVIMISGFLSLKTLPIAQYPEIAPPQVQVHTFYPGAISSLIAKTVAQPIEEQINGVEKMIYMSSNSTNNGEYILDVTFEIGTNMDIAQMQVQNRIAQIKSQLPQEVQRMGVTVRKSTNNILLFINLTSTNGWNNDLFLSNYVNLNIRDQLTRLEGVDSAWTFGAGDYSMRIWMDPELMKTRGISTSDIISAIKEQNVQVAAGQIGQSPDDTKQAFQYAINVEGQLQGPEQFGEIILKSLPSGNFLRIKDIAKIELGAKSYDVGSQVNGQDSASVGIFLKPGANALKTAESVKTRMLELSKEFPPELKYNIPFDTTTFIQTSIKEVVKTLYISIILVILVILIFLQNWRAALIPAITIPVALIGTLSIMSLLGVSINMLSLFGLVLAIGIVVDDSIVVVENVTRNLIESNKTPKLATIQAMEEVTGPIFATTIILLAVFIPTAFLGGITGQLYRQFALTIATATVFSSINALTLSPALSALILKRSVKKSNTIDRLFDRFFNKINSAYGLLVSASIKRGSIVLIIFITLSGIIFLGFNKLPKGFVPEEDQGWAMVVVQLPDASSLERTKNVINTVNQRLATMPGIKDYISVSGYSIMDGGAVSNAGVIWVVFDPWEERTKEGLNLDSMIGQLWASVTDIQEAMVFAFPPPPIYGLGNTGGFEMLIQDRSNMGMGTLQKVTTDMMMAANQNSSLQQIFSTFSAKVPQLDVKVDRHKAKFLGIRLDEIFETLQANLGSVYVNDFNKFGHIYQVRLQADSNFRANLEDISKLEVKNNNGFMIPLGSVINVSYSLGPQVIKRYNMYPSANLNGNGIPGISSGQAMNIMEKLGIETLPLGMGFEWTGMSFQEKDTQGQTLLVTIFAIIFVYLVLCAQYESWSLPLSVILSVPLGFFGTLVAITIFGLNINIYTQIGLLLLIALSCKTAILITEFAKTSRDKGNSINNSALNAAKLRFRPILMTAFTFILGVFPLVLASGAGASSRKALGTAVFSGMISATLLIIFFVPTFYALIQKKSESIQMRFRSK